MPRAEKRFVIKDMYRRALMISDIARVTRHDRKTIRAIVNGPFRPEPKGPNISSQLTRSFRASPGKAYRGRRTQPQQAV